MSVLTWPRYKVASFRWRRVEQAVPFKSVFGSQALEVASPRWEVDMGGVVQQHAQALRILNFLESIGGFRHQIALFNLVQPIPAGTLRGAPVLFEPAVAGDVVLRISAGLSQAGRTLMDGDLLGIGSSITQHVVRVKGDAVADGDGDLVVNLSTPLRNSFDSGVVIVWDRPAALFRQKEINQGIQFIPKFGQPWTLSLVEDWRP